VGERPPCRSAARSSSILRSHFRPVPKPLLPQRVMKGTPPSNSASLIESLTEIGLKVLRWNNRNSIPFILTIDHIRR
jgi:hypothetical protein